GEGNGNRPYRRGGPGSPAHRGRAARLGGAGESAPRDSGKVPRREVLRRQLHDSGQRGEPRRNARAPPARPGGGGPGAGGPDPTDGPPRGREVGAVRIAGDRGSNRPRGDERGDSGASASTPGGGADPHPVPGGRQYGPEKSRLDSHP